MHCNFGIMFYFEATIACCKKHQQAVLSLLDRKQDHVSCLSLNHSAEGKRLLKMGSLVDEKKEFLVDSCCMA